MSRQSNTKAHIGKTRRDRASGALARREHNQMARADWCRNDKATIKDFPFNVCNGKDGRRWKKWMGML